MIYDVISKYYLYSEISKNSNFIGIYIIALLRWHKFVAHAKSTRASLAQHREEI